MRVASCYLQVPVIVHRAHYPQLTIVLNVSGVELHLMRIASYCLQAPVTVHRDYYYRGPQLIGPNVARKNG